jgi:very-short-patch-repair endonuclease
LKNFYDTSPAETSLASLLRRAKIKGWKRQYSYVPGRKFKADFAFPLQKLIVEVDGGVYSRRAHGSIGGIIADMKRSNFAAMNGWRLMRFRPDEITKQPDSVIEQITIALEYGDEE